MSGERRLMSINGSIQHRFGIPTEIGKTVSPNKTISDILAHRSYRAYKPNPVPKDLLLTLFAVAFSSPSKSDLQQACVIRIEDQAKQKRIAELSPYTLWVESAHSSIVRMAGTPICQ